MTTILPPPATVDLTERIAPRGRLIDAVGRGEHRPIVTFAGQGAAWLGELRELVGGSPGARHVLAVATPAIDAALAQDRLRWAARLPEGLGILGWVDDPDSAPAPQTLARAAVSMTGAFLTQACRMAALLEEGADAALTRAVAMTGHSQGLLGACLAAELVARLRSEDEADAVMAWFRGRVAELVHLTVVMGVLLDAGAPGRVDVGPEGPTPMLAIAGVDRAVLEVFLTGVNQAAPGDQQATLALDNGYRRHVVSGAPATLRLLVDALERRAAAEAEERADGQRGGRPLDPVTEWVGVSTPFHSPGLSDAAAAVVRACADHAVALHADAFGTPVIDPRDGSTLTGDVLERVVRSIACEPVRWQQTIVGLISTTDADLVLDLGPGDGVANVTAGSLRGRGVEVIGLTTTAGRRRLLTAGATPTAAPLDYATFLPGVATLPDGRQVLDTRFTRLTGRPPAILAGMTPTTVDVEIVAAAANAGYVAELAGGGQVTEEILAERFRELGEQLDSGQGVVFNALYLDPYLWGLHLERGLVTDAARSGTPLDGVTISAGIPPRDEAVALLEQLQEAGLWLNAFKPGTVAQVDQVLAIAEDVGDMPVFLHLEGGLAGGHHSWEALDDLLLATYDRIRRHDNVVLCVGGGIADPDHGASLLLGDWSLAHDRPAMPVDALLLGTVTMAAAEATTSTAVKQLLVDTPGTPGWVTRGRADGDMTSGLSGLDADIHYIDNAAARCGRLLDEVAGDADAVEERRAEIVEALERTAKPYFGDLDAMTYGQVLDRLVDLMTTGRDADEATRYEDGVWPDRTWRQRTADAIARAEDRLASAGPRSTGGPIDGLVARSVDRLVDPGLRALDDPRAVLDAFAARYGHLDRPLHPVDVDWFITDLCARPGKPVGFVPVIDADVRRWYKSDSLWQAHDARFSADQVLVIPGPAAVAGITAVDEPVADILGRFADRAASSAVEGGVDPVDVPWLPTVVVDGAGGAGPGSAGHGGRGARGVVQRLGGPVGGLLSSPVIGVGDRVVANPLRTLALRGGGVLDVEIRDGVAHTARVVQAGRTVLHASDVDGDVRLVSFPATGHGLDVRVQVRRSAGLPLATVPAEAWGDAIGAFVAGQVLGTATGEQAMTVGDGPAAALVAPFETATATVLLDPWLVAGYADVTGHPSGTPLGQAFTAAWPALFAALHGAVGTDLLSLVHLGDDIRTGPGWPIAAGDDGTLTGPEGQDTAATAPGLLTAAAEVVGIIDSGTPTRREVVVRSTIRHGGAVAATLRSRFLIRTPSPSTWRHREEDVIDLPELAGHRDGLALQPGDAAWIAAQPWFRADAEVLDGERLGGRVSWTVHGATDADAVRVTASGALTLDGRPLGTVSLDTHRDAGQHPTSGAPEAGHHLNPVVAAIEALAGRAGDQRPAASDTAPRTLASTRVVAPADMTDFATTGGDRNPIHTDPVAAALAGLDAPIVHGMWTFSRVIGLIADEVCDGDGARITAAEVDFLGMVPLGATLDVRVVRRSVRDGAIGVEASVSHDDAPVLRATVTVAAPRTAMVFPGQGIQHAQMGMEGYERSVAARRTWEAADRFTRRRFGFSVLDVVRDNPTELVVDGVRQAHPKGVLNLTQFTQVSMAVLACAQVAELTEAGLTSPDTVLAGHSVGEYTALAAIGGVMALEDVVEVVYQRGMAMHRLVPRDAEGRSDYAMGVLRPNHAGLDHAGAEALVTEVAAETGEFLQIVNLNIRGRQYAVTGTLAGLDALAAALRDRRRAGGKDPFVEVPGIDVPFHSRVLHPGVPAFADVLRDRLPADADYLALVDRYIPNLVARPFALDAGFIGEIVRVTGSQAASVLLAERDARVADDANGFARELLVELLAWQFASPVRWIETQELLLTPTSPLAVDRVLEVGVGNQPTLAVMAKASSAGIRPLPTAEILNIEADAPTVFLTDVDPVEEPALADASSGQAEDGDAGGPTTGSSTPGAPSSDTTTSPEPAAASATAAPVTTAPATTAPSAGGGPIADVAFDHATALRSILSHQAKLRPDQLSGTETIDDVFDGVSARRNQVLMDLGKEFDLGAIDGAHTQALDALADELAGRAARWRGPGPYLRGVQDAAIAKAMARAGVGRPELDGHLRTLGLDDGLVATVLDRLALELREGDSARGGPLGAVAGTVPASRDAAEALVADVAGMVADELGFTLSGPAAASGGGTAVDAAVVDELAERILGPDGVLMSQARGLAERLGHELDLGRASAAPAEAGERLSEELTALRSPAFDPAHHVVLDSAWAWARRDLVDAWYDVANDRIDDATFAARIARLAAFTTGPDAGPDAATSPGSDPVTGRDGRGADPDHEDPDADLDVRATARWVAEQAGRRGRDDVAAVIRGTLLHGVAVRPGLPTSASRPVVTVTADGPEVQDLITGDATALLDEVRARLAATGGDGAAMAAWTDGLDQLAAGAADLRGRTALVNGASPGSIAIDVVAHLLRGGARVVVTTSRAPSAKRMADYRRLYATSAGPGAELHVIGCNLGSGDDVDALIDWLRTRQTAQQGAEVVTTKPAFDVDLVLPFGALADTGTADAQGDRARAAIDIMLLGVTRLVTGLAADRLARGPADRLVHVVLPLSPNHGVFGGDGAYAETKAGLETLLAKQQAESDAWGAGCTLVGARIGWVRGTGLMDANDPVAARLEARDLLRTFSTEEMALLLTGLCLPSVARSARTAAVRADLTAGFDTVSGFRAAVDEVRDELTEEVRRARRAAALDDAAGVDRPAAGDGSSPAVAVAPRPGWPAPAVDPRHRQPWGHDLDGATLDNSVVIVGLGEVGPYGSSRTRWEIEVDDALSPAGVAELAWMTGLITYDRDARRPGWIDTETGEPVAEGDLADAYADRLRDVTGIRFVDPDIAGYDADASPVLAEAYLDRDFTFAVASAEEAAGFTAADPEGTVVTEHTGGRWTVTRRAGTVVRVPKVTRLSRRVAGLLPTGWDVTRLGIAADLVDRVDPLTLFNLTATTEALLGAGMTPEELMSRVHPARVANTQGAGLGGMASLGRMYHDHLLGRERQADVLQESLINVMAGYVVQGLIGSYGAMAHPVGACATAAMSVEAGVDKILSDRADVVVAGGYDDIGVEGMIGFGDMGATAETDVMLGRGIEPGAMSRANDRRRKGFVEAHGGGTMLLARARVAADLGLPVLGVVAWAGSFSDGIHTSIPAPGQGVLAAASGGQRSPLGIALSRFGLTADDVAVVSKHDTSTAANDPNEALLHDRIQTALGRIHGNPLWVVSQKALTGHAKGGAAAWQLAGLCQALTSGVIPGNRNLESVDQVLADRRHLVFTDRPVRPGPAARMDAGLVTSLGFGHVGAVLLVIHPDAFVALVEGDPDVEPGSAQRWAAIADQRIASAQQRTARIMIGREIAHERRTDRRFAAADGSAAQSEEEAAMLLDPGARLDPATGRYVPGVASDAGRTATAAASS